MAIRPNPVFADLPISIFQHMTGLALKHDAINLGQGFPDQDGPLSLREVAAKHDASVAEVALAWILAKPFVTSIIIGAKRIEQLEQNLAAVKLKLDADDIAKLDEVSALEAEYPSWMVPRQNAARVPQPFEPKG